jgi:hypothetical protein
MSGLIVSGLLSLLFLSSEPLPHSYLYQPAFSLDKKLRCPAMPYDLQPGDICFAVNNHTFSKIGHHLSGAGLPNHSMIVFAQPDGRLAIAEAGPHSELKVAIIDALEHLQSYEDEGSRVWVRRRTTPLTPEQSACLTSFCTTLDERKFATVRLLGQLTPFRTRFPLRTAVLGKSNLERSNYFCSELVLNALIAAGALDAKDLRPAATFPSDLFYGHSSNFFVNRGVRHLNCEWAPPARWTGCPVHAQTTCR